MRNVTTRAIPRPGPLATPSLASHRPETRARSATAGGGVNKVVSLWPSPIALLLCPLCFEESGQRTAIVAEYDLRTAPLVTVADLVGCPHGARFGRPGALTIADEHRMTQAALEMWDARQQDKDEVDERFTVHTRRAR